MESIVVSVPSIPEVLFTLVVRELSVHICPVGIVCQKLPEYFASVHLMRKESDGRSSMVGARVIDNRQPIALFDVSLFDKIEVASRLNPGTKKIDVNVSVKRQ
jgi:hypothetical protein